jgi:anti-anti-sigma factor
VSRRTVSADGSRAESVPKPFEVEVRPERDAVRLCPSGEVDIATVDRLREELQELKSAGFKRVILDLRQATFLDSAGLHLVLEADAASRADGWDFAVIQGPPVVQRSFEVAGLLGQLPFVDAGPEARLS